MDRVEAESTLNINLCHEGMVTQVYDGVHGIIDCGVFEGEVSHIDSIINTIPWWEREVHDEAPCA